MHCVRVRLMRIQWMVLLFYVKGKFSMACIIVSLHLLTDTSISSNNTIFWITTKASTSSRCIKCMGHNIQKPSIVLHRFHATTSVYNFSLQPQLLLQSIVSSQSSLLVVLQAQKRANGRWTACSFHFDIPLWSKACVTSFTTSSIIIIIPVLCYWYNIL